MFENLFKKMISNKIEKALTDFDFIDENGNENKHKHEHLTLFTEDNFEINMMISVNHSRLTLEKIYNTCNNVCCFMNNCSTDLEKFDCYNRNLIIHKSISIDEYEEKLNVEFFVKTVFEIIETYTCMNFCIMCQKNKICIDDYCENCITFNYFNKIGENCSICHLYINNTCNNSMSICDNKHFIHKTCFKQLIKKECPLCRCTHQCDFC